MLNFTTMKGYLNLLGMATLVPTDVGFLLNMCQDEEADQYEWSWRQTNSMLYTFAPYSVGTVDVTQGSVVVTGHGTNWTSALNWFQLSFGPSSLGVQVNAITSPTTLSLTQPYMAPSRTGVSYSLRQSFHIVQGATEVTAVKNIVYLEKTSRQVLNLTDPQRLSIGGNPCLAWAPAPYSYLQSTGIPTPLGTQPYQAIELWPVPSAAVAYVVEYRAGAQPMVNDGDIPVVASAVLMAKAMMYLAQSAYASNGAAQWKALADKYEQEYLRQREDAQFQDRKRSLTRNEKDPRPLAGLDYVPLHDITFG